MSSEKGSLLVVDDDELNRDMLSWRLLRNGYKVSVAASGAEALEMAARQSFDLVLLDVMMPDLNGIDVLRALRQTFLPSQLPVIMATAKGESDDVVQALELGANDYVTKPIDFDRLMLIIEARIAGVARTKRASKIPKLNSREIEVLTWVSRGKTSPEIARKLGLAKRTVDFHVDNARTKLGAETRTEAAIKALAIGLIKP